MTSFNAALLRVAQITLELEAPQAPETLASRLLLATETLGGTTYLLGVRGAIKSTGKPVQYAETNFTKEWQQHYDSKGLVAVDPYLRRAVSTPGPFRFDEVQADEKGRAYQSELAQQGLLHGMMCTHRHSTFMGMVMVAGHQPIAKDSWPYTAVILNLFAAAATRAAVAILEKENPAPVTPPVELTPTERSVLELKAQGKTDAAVGQELRMPPRTVMWNMDRVAAKLNLGSRKEVVAEALARGLIHKRHFPAPRFSDVG